jgi:hypothetical protein
VRGGGGWSDAVSKLDIEDREDANRRVLAVLAYVRAG